MTLFNLGNVEIFKIECIQTKEKKYIFALMNSSKNFVWLPIYFYKFKINNIVDKYRK